MFKSLPEQYRFFVRVSLSMLVAVIFLVLPTAVLAAPQQSREAISLVHREIVPVGPYQLTIGFSEWPIRAERSLDMLFLPEDGITAKKGTLTFITPSGKEEKSPLVRHPRQRTAWGRDIIALPEQGQWTMRFAVSGPQGAGSGQYTFSVLERPGPPILLSWLPTLAVALILLSLPFLAWWRVKPLQSEMVWKWRDRSDLMA